MLISHFKNISDTFPRTKEKTWSEFVDEIKTHLEVSAKENATLISPAEWPEGARRSKVSVLRLHFAALDLDKISDEVLSNAKQILAPYEYFLHTTYSHADSKRSSGLHCLRVLLPLSRPVEAREWPRFWEQLYELMQRTIDPSCKDLSRMYFTPSMPLGTESLNTIEIHRGKILEVDELLSQKTREPQTQLVMHHALSDFARALQSKKDTYFKNMGTLLQRISKGEVFAEPGSRDSVLFKLCALLAEKWPHAAAAQIADYFKESLAKMEESCPGAPTIDNVIEKLERQQREAILKKLKSANHELDSSREDIFEAFGGQRDTPYSEEELNAFATESDVTRSRLNKRWIIRKGDNCYLFMGGEYGSPVSVGELVDAAKIDLAAAVSSGVDFYRYNKKEEKIMKSEKDLLRDYSTLARHIHVDLAAQKSKYNWKTKTLIEAPCPLRLTTPEFSPEVDQYLRLLGGQYAEQLLDWVSLVTKLDEPCAALFLHGASGAGKSLLTLGLSRLWTVGTPTQIRDVLSNFNDALVGSPLVIADEKIHSSNNKEVGSAELRNLIQEYSRPLRRKFQANSTLMGALRVIITANNTNVLGWKENLNGSDIKAIQDRILSIHVGSESANFLRALSHQQRCDFVDKDVIAKHALWLRDTRVHKGNVRFLVEGCDQSFHYSLVTNNGINSAVLHWLVGYLQDPQKLDSKGVYQVRIYDGRLLVNVQALVEHWDLYKTNTDKNVAVAHRISMTLSNLSESTKKQLPNGMGTNTSYWKIQTDYLLNWSRDTGYASDEEILAALAKNSVLPGHKKAKAFV